MGLGVWGWGLGVGMEGIVEGLVEGVVEGVTEGLGWTASHVSHAVANVGQRPTAFANRPEALASLLC